jgi:hypothetical protein
VTASSAGRIAIAHRRIGSSSVITLLSEVHVNDTVATHFACKMTGRIANVTGRPVEIAVVTGFSEVFDAISAFLGRHAVVAAMVGNEYTADHLAIDDVAIVANLAGVDDAIPTATDIDTHCLTRSTFLPGPAKDAATERLQGGVSACSREYYQECSPSLRVVCSPAITHDLPLLYDMYSSDATLIRYSNVAGWIFWLPPGWRSASGTTVV